MSESDNKSAVGLIGDLLTQVSQLFRKELQLFRAEVGEKVDQVAVALGLLVAGLIFVVAAINVLAAALVAAAAAVGVPGGWAALVVGLVITIAGYLLIQQGLTKLKAARLAPERTLQSLKKDATVLEETVK
ncbi:MAG: phage holin family protein [Rhodospirillales bacterium]